MNVTRYNPQRLYRRPAQNNLATQGEEKFSWKGHALAAGFAVTSVFKEAVHYGQLLVGALSDPDHLSIQDRIQRADNSKTAIAKHRRTYYSTPNPPLAEQSSLKDLPDAQLKRPIMLVPGWDMAHDRFLTLTEKLTEHGPATVYVNDGEFYSDRDCEHSLSPEQVSKDSKVFVSVFNSIGESPETTVPQLEANMAALKKLTGAERPDMMGYSQGGLATRTYLDQSGEHIGKFLMLGTPNLGAGLADVSKFMYNAQDKGYAVDWLMARNNIDDHDESAMRLMASDSPRLADLNSRWDKQMEQTEGYLVVGSANDRTVHWGPKLFAPGDGLVEAKNLAPKGEEVHLIEPGPWDDHANLPYSASAYQEMHQHFDGASAVKKSFLEEQRAVGTFDSEGEFTLGQGAARKLAVFNLPDPSYWILKIIQAAVVCGAAEIRIRQGSKATIITFCPEEPCSAPSLSGWTGGESTRSRRQSLPRRAITVPILPWALSLTVMAKSKR